MYVRVCVCVCARVCACVRACMHASMRACVRACVHACVLASNFQTRKHANSSLDQVNTKMISEVLIKSDAK